MKDVLKKLGIENEDKFKSEEVKKLNRKALEYYEKGLKEIAFTDHVDYGIKKDWDEGPIEYRDNNEPFANVDYPKYFKEIEELNGAIEVCEQIKEDNSDEKDFPQDHFWNVVNNREKQGEKFNEIIKDYLEIELDVLKRIFGLKHTKRKLSFKQIILIALAMCTIRGVMCQFVWKSATFLEGFSYPLAIFALVSIIIAPLCYFAHKNPKIATILIYIIFILAGLLFGGIALIFIIALFNTIFG